MVLFSGLKFTLQQKDTGSKARAGTLETDHGTIETPIFMPVGTAGTVKGVHQRELKQDINPDIILGNTYHLYLRPGMEILEQAGGLHAFMGWDRNILTDSGGYQVYSLSDNRKITEEGVTFKSHIDGSKHFFSPERAMDIQRTIGADIIMAFDECTPYPCDYDYAKKSMHMTHRWLERCIEHFNSTPSKYGYEQTLFPIVQGSTYTDLRKQSAEYIASVGAEGNAIGGLSVGEPAEEMYAMTEVVCDVLPEDKPRYLMGVGYPLDLVVCVALGVDMFDCVYPTRTARFGVALIDGEHPGTLRLKLQAHLQDDRPIMKDCDCQACRNGISRKTLHEWLKTNNAVAAQLLTQHNIAYMMRLVRSMREAILEDRYGEYCRDFVRMQFRGKENGGTDVPGWVVDALQAAGIEL